MPADPILSNGLLWQQSGIASAQATLCTLREWISPYSKVISSSSVLLQALYVFWFVSLSHVTRGLRDLFRRMPIRGR